MVIGDVEIVPLLDAYGHVGGYDEAFPDVGHADWVPYTDLYSELSVERQWHFPVTVYLLRSRDRTVLVDTGVGPPGNWDFWTPRVEGLLPSALAAIDIEDGDVDVVFLTHLDPDHVGWNTDADGAPRFTDARHVTHADALAFALSCDDEPHVRRCIEPLVDRFDLVDDGADIAEGIRARLLPGHYPGQMGLSVRSRGEHAELIADIAPHPALLDRPGWVFAWEEVAVQTSTRADLVGELIDTEALLVCGHYPGSGIGRVVRRDGRTTWEEARARDSLASTMPPVGSHGDLVAR